MVILWKIWFAWIMFLEDESTTKCEPPGRRMWLKIILVLSKVREDTFIRGPGPLTKAYTAEHDVLGSDNLLNINIFE